MLLYHGSHTIVEVPALNHSRKNTDFGRGFYTTTNFDQAAQWAEIKREREAVKYGYVSIFEMDENVLSSPDYNIFKFTGPTEKWLDFVVANRRGAQTEEYDMVEGPVANDRLYATIALYEQGILSAKACIEQLQTHKLFNQLSFNTEKAIKLLSYIEAKRI